ncbi:unnamed protein product [Lymnaea stagnalis]|uniref:adenylate cyclase n=1 Tax=Lymnaea stagnalis TaxID=6523 RepID=A0AAV2IKR9_LYMST
MSAKARIELAYKDKERLLLSVLPKHVADEMLKDVGNLDDGQFRKIYMSRYENVSILFADIVGFTAISSSVTASELVKILNELFASFDVLAKKFHQTRIKILGDCYYCVCGALKPRSDHAVLSIHMGLSMVEAISTVRRSTGKDVNMRVGVHTGACLGGVLGQRQWQFDILGKEVTLANKMESGGLPGRVHLSEKTKSCLHDEFELEDGHGGDRDDTLKLSNIVTYLVKSVKKPVSRLVLTIVISLTSRLVLTIVIPLTGRLVLTIVIPLTSRLVLTIVIPLTGRLVLTIVIPLTGRLVLTIVIPLTGRLVLTIVIPLTSRLESSTISPSACGLALT